jgi:UDP-glucose 4-epimerase
MEVLVTGATGQIGSRLIEVLIEKGINTIVMARNLDRSEIVKKFIIDKKVRLLQMDLVQDIKHMEKALKMYHPDILIHLGSVVDQRSGFFDSCRQMISVNMIGTINLLKCLPHLKMICFPSSTSVYGIPGYLPIDENHPTYPVNTYCASKLSVEKFLAIYSKQQKVPTAILRIASVYSELHYAPELKRAIPDFLRAIRDGNDLVVWGPGGIKRNFIFVDDVVSAILLVVKKRKNGVFNIASKRSETVKNAAETIKMLTGEELLIKYKDVNEIGVDCEFDISRAGAELGFNPKFNLKDGLSRCLDALNTDIFN